MNLSDIVYWSRCLKRSCFDWNVAKYSKPIFLLQRNNITRYCLINSLVNGFLITQSKRNANDQSLLYGKWANDTHYLSTMTNVRHKDEMLSHLWNCSPLVFASTAAVGSYFQYPRWLKRSTTNHIEGCSSYRRRRAHVATEQVILRVHRFQGGLLRNFSSDFCSKNNKSFNQYLQHYIPLLTNLTSTFTTLYWITSIFYFYERNLFRHLCDSKTKWITFFLILIL